MLMFDFIEGKKEEGMTINRIAKVLGVTQPTIQAHYNGDAEKVNLKLAKNIYKLFDVVIEPYLEVEVKSNENT